VLLELEAVRDRFIRIAGGTDIRATTLALNDAGERLSKILRIAVPRQLRGRLCHMDRAHPHRIPHAFALGP